MLERKSFFLVYVDPLAVNNARVSLILPGYLTMDEGGRSHQVVLQVVMQRILKCEPAGRLASDY